MTLPVNPAANAAVSAGVNTGIVWAAWGLNPRLTGIERQIVGVVRESSGRGLLTAAAPGVVVVDADAEWADDLAGLDHVSLMPVQRRSGALIAAPRRPDLAGRALRARVLHSFGARPPGGWAETCVYSVHDWGPLVDRRLPARTRVLWGTAMLAGLRMADTIHTEGAVTLESGPQLARRTAGAGARRAWVHAAAAEGPSAGTLSPAEAQQLAGIPRRAVLSVGSADLRKRLPALKAASARAGVPLVLAGAGTEHLDGPGCTGLGRVSERLVAALYDGCAATALISGYEGLGLTVAEGAAHGKRSLVTAAVAAVQPQEVRPYLTVVADDASEDTIGRALRTVVAEATLPPLRWNGLAPLLDCYRDLLGT